jgi:hypothetical protein
MKQYSYLIAPEDWKKMTQAKRSTELTHIRTARGINIHTANTGALSSATSAAARATPSTAATPTPSDVLSLPGSIVPPGTKSAGGSNNLIRQILSSNRTQVLPPPGPPPMVSTEELNQVDRTFYNHVNTININYDLSNHGTSAVVSFLMDGGINGGMTGSDVGLISTLDVHKAKVTRIGETTFDHLPLVTAAGFVDTHHGPAIIFLHQYAH